MKEKVYRGLSKIGAIIMLLISGYSLYSAINAYGVELTYTYMLTAFLLYVCEILFIVVPLFYFGFRNLKN